MATASSFLSEEHFMCSICLDVFTEPVSLPCGHNFCKACIGKHWKDKEHCQCPMCNEKFNRRLKVHVNTGFREVVENFKKHCAEANPSQAPVQPGEVPCDRCVGTKFKALKTCLVCKTSYCETHLDCHQKDVSFMSHQLTDPVRNPLEVVCKKHNRILELFCRDDLTQFCDQCREHRGHDTVPLEEEYQEKMAQLERKKAEVEEMIQERQKKVQELEEAARSKRRDKDEVTANSSQTFVLLVASIERRLNKLHQVMEEKQKAVERQAGTLVKELKEEITELQRRGNNLRRISHIEDHLKLIKSSRSVSSSTSHTKNWSDIMIHGHHHAEAVRRAMEQLEDTLTKEMEQGGADFRECCSPILSEETVKKPVRTVADLETLPEGIRLDIIRQQYSVDMTFDPCTASDLLLFSEDMKQVRTSHIWWFANGQHKFNRYVYILGKKSFSEGKFYYEVQVEFKTGWDLGVVRESAIGMRKFTPNYRNGCWIIRLRNNTNFKALLNSHVHLPVMKKPTRVGVFVDYEKGVVSFYDADTATLIYSFTGCAFNEKIFPFFSPGPSDDGMNDTPLILSSSSPTKRREQNQPPQKMRVGKQPSDDTLRYILMTIILCVIITSIKSAFESEI